MCKEFNKEIHKNSEGNYHNGVPLEECFPYQADHNISCDDKCPDWLDKLVPMLDAGWWSRHDEDIMFFKRQIMEKGPAVTDMFVNDDFISWEMTHHDPDDYYPYVEANRVNHCVIIVGWKDDPFIPKGGYWMIKDSHGTERGYDGFFNIEYGSLKINECLDWIEYDPESYEWPNEPNPPSMTKITGETNGNIETEYEYIFNSVDPEGFDLRYCISWGDGDWEWTEFYPSGEDITVKHTYNTQGDYSVVALAMNINDNIGPWGTLQVTMPRNKIINRPILNFLNNHPNLFPILRQLLLKI